MIGAQGSGPDMVFGSSEIGGKLGAEASCDISNGRCVNGLRKGGEVAKFGCAAGRVLIPQLAEQETGCRVSCNTAFLDIKKT